MGTILSVLKKYKDLRDRLDNMAVESIENTKSAIVDLNRQQLEEGLTSSGGRFRRYRSESYAFFKHDKNPIPGLYNPDLNLTGAFYSKIEIKVTEDELIFQNTDPKAAMLEESYGEANIYGLTPDSKIRYISQDLWPVFISKVKSFLAQ